MMEILTISSMLLGTLTCVFIFRKFQKDSDVLTEHLIKRSMNEMFLTIDYLCKEVNAHLKDFYDIEFKVNSFDSKLEYKCDDIEKMHAKLKEKIEAAVKELKAPCEWSSTRIKDPQQLTTLQGNTISNITKRLTELEKAKKKS